MFNRNKEQSDRRSYLEILKRINALPDYLPKMSSDFAETLSDQKKGKLLNQIMTNKEELTALVVWLKSNDRDNAFINRVSYICGSVIEDEKDLEVFLTGLASDSWLSKISVDDAVKEYRNNPALVIIRLLEIVNIRG